MELLTNGLLIAATLFAGGYCWVLARRVGELKSLDKGLGKSIVTLTRQVELARNTLEESRHAAKVSRSDLTDLLRKAEDAAALVTEATEAAQDMERGLRYQISQASERKRILEKEQMSTSDMATRSHQNTIGMGSGNRRFENLDSDQPPEKPKDPPSRSVDPAPEVFLTDESSTFCEDASEEAKKCFAEVHEETSAKRQSSRLAKSSPSGPRPASIAEAIGQGSAAISQDDGAHRAPMPNADEIEPWQPKKTDSVLRAGADLLTLKPLKPKATKTSDLPKPQSLPPLGNPLRNKSAVSSIDDEDELLEALSQLAAGGKR